MRTESELNRQVMSDMEYEALKSVRKRFKFKDHGYFLEGVLHGEDYVWFLFPVKP